MTAQTPSDDGPEAPEIQECLDKYLPKIKSKDKKEREAVLHQLRFELQSMRNAKPGKKKFPKRGSRKRISKELINLYENTTDKDFSNERIRAGLLYEITMNGDDEIARPYIFQKLDKGTERERGEIFRALGAPGAITGDDVYEKIKELRKRGDFGKDGELYLLARINKDRALPEILKELETSTDKKIVLHTARTLQNTYENPEHYRLILPKIKMAGLDKDDSFEGGDGLFWINQGLLAEYIDTATGDELRLALEIATTRAGTIPPKAIPILSQKLEDKNPQIRILAIAALKKTADRHSGQTDRVVDILRSALEKESVPEVQKAIQEMLGRIQREQEAWERLLERLKREKQK